MALASAASFDFTEEAFECEHAAVHLEACCPDLELYFGLCHHDTGCSADATPELSIDESTCLQRYGCEELVSSGICAEAEVLSDPTHDDYVQGHGYPEPRRALCPR